MATLIKYIGTEKVISSLVNLHEKIRRGEPILSIDRDQDIGSLPPIIAIYGGQYIFRSDKEYSCSIIADEAAEFLPLTAPTAEEGGKIRLARFEGDRNIRTLFKDPRFPELALDRERLPLLEKGVLYCTDELFLVRDAVVKKLVEMTR